MDTSTTRPCPDCLGEIPAEASFCRHCGERVVGKRCSDCGTRCWDAARKCRACGYAFEVAGTEPEFEPFTVLADPAATLLVRFRFLRRRIQLTRDKIVVSTPGPFNLSIREEEIPWTKVAGFEYHSGLLWDSVTIETRGQSTAAISCLNKRDGVRIRAVLQRLEL